MRFAQLEMDAGGLLSLWQKLSCGCFRQHLRIKSGYSEVLVQAHSVLSDMCNHQHFQLCQVLLSFLPSASAHNVSESVN